MIYIRYFVDGFGEQMAGPYPPETAQSQLEDIAGYEGVRNAHIYIVDAPPTDALTKTMDNLSKAFDD